jgi:superfamily II DNA or RNA helicase
MSTLAPGARIVVRDAEWLVRSKKIASSGVAVIEAVGLSDFIKGKRAQFIADLETDLTVLDPKDTGLVADDSAGYQRSLLFIEAHLRQTAPTETDLYVGHRAAMDVLPFQLDPTLKALRMPRQRLLIADAVGLGKTLEAGILVSELMRRGRARRILVITTKSMLTQFQKEFWTRFTIPLVRLDSIGIQRIRTRIPTNHNPFHYYDKAIVSVDTLKQDREYRTYLEQAHWDVIVIDECHNVARRGRGQSASLRSQLAARLSTRSDTLIMLSATPHDGRPESFASLMNMLDPTAIANEASYTKDDIRDLYVRRFKKDVAAQLLKHFPERQVQAVEAPASPAEERAFDQLNALTLAQTDEKRQAGNLFKTTLLKAMLSSPMACLQTIQTRIRNLEKKPSSPRPPSPQGDEGARSGSPLPGGEGVGVRAADLTELRELETAVAAIVTPADRSQGSSKTLGSEGFSKYQTLLRLITQTDEGGFGWTGKDTRDRIVIFTERLETMRFLARQLGEDLKLKPEAIATLDGGMNDVDQMAVIEQFGNEKSPLRLLVATDVASEGINLHYLSHRLIHFDIPWSLMALQQRNGRIDRYGQEQQPQIRYLLSRSRHPRMDEVERIIRVLLVKDEQAVQNIGDPSAFMGVFDVDEEVRITATAIEQGETAESFDQRLTPQAQPDDFDPFALFDQEPEVSQEADAQAALRQWPSLFASDFDYASAALDAISQGDELQINRVPAKGLIELTMPQELRQRYSRLPREIVPRPDQPLILCSDPKAIAAALEEARRSEDSWPAMQYLWGLHPVVEWLSDRAMTTFGRHQAPVLTLPQGIGPQEVVFVMAGVIPNRRGQPVINRWLSVVFHQGQFQRVEDFDQTLARTHLGKAPIPNQGQPVDEALLELRGVAVDQATQALLAERQAFIKRLEPELEQQRQRLEGLRGRHYEQLELRFGDDSRPAAFVQARKDREKSRIERIFEDQRRWVEESMTTEPAPYIKIIAVLQGDGG